MVFDLGEGGVRTVEIDLGVNALLGLSGQVPIALHRQTLQCGCGLAAEVEDAEEGNNC